MDSLFELTKLWGPAVPLIAFILWRDSRRDDTAATVANTSDRWVKDTLIESLTLSRLAIQNNSAALTAFTARLTDCPCLAPPTTSPPTGTSPHGNL